MEDDQESSSDASSLKLATESSGDAEESSEGEDSEENVIEKPPEVKELPARATRGRRLGGITKTEDDQLFWEHETWEEEDDDEEWETEDEGHYKDKFDSDFLSSNSSNEGDTELQGERLDKELNQEEKRQKKKFDYERIAKRRKKRKETSNKVWSVFDLEKQHNAQQTACNGVGSGRRRGGPKFLTQADHLRIAKQTEEVNKKILLQIADEIENRKLRQGQQNVETVKAIGELQAWVSWSSDRKIEHEESKKSQAQRDAEAKEPVKERQLLFFLDLAHPKESQIPPMYRQTKPLVSRQENCAVFPHIKAKYRDPATGMAYSNVEAFETLRTQSMQQDLARVCDVLQRSIEKTATH